METINKLLERFKKNPKIIVVCGLVGVLLIFLSSFIDFSEKTVNTSASSAQKTQEYAQELEQRLKEQIGEVVSGKVKVMVTLNTGVEYVYASESKNDESSVEDEGSQSGKSKSDKKSENNYILYKDENGNEVPLVVTEIMPRVKGVVVGCENGENEVIASAVKSLVTTALDISDSKVCVVGLDLG